MGRVTYRVRQGFLRNNVFHFQTQKVRMLEPLGHRAANVGNDDRLIAAGASSS